MRDPWETTEAKPPRAAVCGGKKLTPVWKASDSWHTWLFQVPRHVPHLPRSANETKTRWLERVVNRAQQLKTKGSTQIPKVYPAKSGFSSKPWPKLTSQSIGASSLGGEWCWKEHSKSRVDKLIKAMPTDCDSHTQHLLYFFDATLW